MPRGEPASALTELDEITRRLRRQCPWDREQDERSIVTHTVEEAYELADAAHIGDDAKLLDELGDVLFQVHFLSLLLEERGAGDLAAVARHAIEKLIRRHPHVFGSVRADTAGEVLRNWDAIKQEEPGRERGIFAEIPANLPALLHARKAQRRAASTGFDVPGLDGPLQAVRDGVAELENAQTPGSQQSFDDVGDLLFGAVNLARKLSVDPELALRGATERFRDRVAGAEAGAERTGERWSELTFERQLEHYLAAALRQGA